MKKVWKKPTVDIISCEVTELQNKIEEMSDEELIEKLKKCSVDINEKGTENRD